jgi:hypothetical protein
VALKTEVQRMGNGAMTRTRATITEGMVDIYKVGLRDAFHMLHMLPLSEKKCGRSPLLSIPTRMPDSFPEKRQDGLRVADTG